MWIWKHTMRDLATGFHIMGKRPEDHERSLAAWKDGWPRKFLGETSYGPGFREYLYLSTDTHTCTWTCVRTHTLMSGCHIALLCWHRLLSRKTLPFPWATSQFDYLLFHAWELHCQDLFNLCKARKNMIAKTLWVLKYVLDRRTYNVSPRRTQISLTDQ